MTDMKAMNQSIVNELWALTAEDDLLDQALAEFLALNHTDTQCLGVLVNLGPLPAGELAEKIGVTKGTLTTVVDRLEDRGFALRVREAGDRRKVFIEATTEGKQYASEIFTSIQKQLLDALNEYNDHERKKLLSFLQLVRKLFALKRASLQERKEQAERFA